jgi:catechol 2,3-dioxygenase-like lactoylglutathione lyase family enzyme
MAIAHLTLATSDVEGTARFLEQALGYARKERPSNSPVETVWLDAGNGQELHVLFVEFFSVSPFEGEFGRHFALTHAASDYQQLRQRLAAAGAELIEPLRPSAVERFFFREPVNGYVFEIIRHV